SRCRWSRRASGSAQPSTVGGGSSTLTSGRADAVVVHRCAARRQLAAGAHKHKHVLVLHEPLRVLCGDGLSDVLLLEERGPRYESAVADSGDERRAFLVRPEAGVDAGGGDHAGDVDQLAVASVGAGGDGDDAAGAQDRGGSGEDLGEAVGEMVRVTVGEVV